MIADLKVPLKSLSYYITSSESGSSVLKQLFIKFPSLNWQRYLVHISATGAQVPLQYDFDVEQRTLALKKLK